MFNLIKTMPRQSHEIVSNKYQVKAFKTMEALREFQNKQYDNDWRILEGHDLKSGFYFSQTDRDGTRYINMKLLNL
jgi:hypothetical protein